MKQVQKCPGPETLAAFSRGELSEADGQAVAEHLEACESCWRQVESSPLEPALADDLKWVSELEEQTVVDVNVPLARLSEALPEYEIIREIGRGGMGIVFEARQIELDRRVALKVLPALLGAVRPDAVARFRREVKLAAGLEHSNIIGVYDFGQVDGTLYYTMPLIEGRSLRDVLAEIADSGAIDVVLEAGSGSGAERGTRSADQEEPPPTSSPKPQVSSFKPKPKGWASSTPLTRLGSSSRSDRAYFRRVAKWIADVAEALEYAHEQGVIHRDVKPSNLLLATSGRLMISDFGLAKAASGDTPAPGVAVTATQTILGTARYMSPEQVDRKAPPIDARVDVYGLGATLYELLAFRPMFAAADDREVLDHVLNREPTPPRRFVRQVPRELETICLKAVEKDRGRRYATAKELRDDLERWLLDLPIHAKRPGPLVRVGKFVRRRKLPVALGSIAAVLLVAAIGIYAAYSASHRAADEARLDARSQRVQVLINEARDALHDIRLDDALGKVDAGLAENPDSAELLRLRASILHHLARDHEALAIYEQLLKQDPDDWKAHYGATFLFQEVIGAPGLRYNTRTFLIHTLPPTECERRLAYHREQVLHLQPECAEAYYLRAAGERAPHRAIEHLNEALERDPQLYEALVARSHRYEQIGDYEAMLLDAERVVALYPGVGHERRGAALRALGRHAEAEQAFTDAIQHDPDNAAWWHNRGLAKCRLGRFAEALADADEAIRLDPEFAYAYLGRARAQKGLGRTDLALQDYDHALKLRPGDIEIYMERGNMQFYAGDPEAAAADMTRIIEIEPRESRAYESRAVAYIVMKRFDRVIADLTRALEIDPSSASAYRYRAYAHGVSKHYEEAVADYTQAIELKPGDPTDLGNRASLFVTLGRYEEAIADLTNLLEIMPGPAVHLQRGMVYELVKAERLALTDYERASASGGRTAAYARLWRHILLRSLGRHEDAAAMLAVPEADGALKPDGTPAAATTAASGDDWTDGLFALFRSECSAADVLAAAATDDERAEANYYIGRRALLNDDHDAARASFEQCLALNRNDILETDFARALLKQLQQRARTAKEATP